MDEKETFHKEERIVEKQLKVWIHCRVSNKLERHLLNYQERLLTTFCKDNELEVIGVTKEIGTGKCVSSYHLSIIKTVVRRHEVNCIVIYDWTRLLISQDMYIEFKLNCELNNVCIIDLMKIKTYNKTFPFIINS